MCHCEIFVVGWSNISTAELRVCRWITRHVIFEQMTTVCTSIRGVQGKVECMGVVVLVV